MLIHAGTNLQNDVGDFRRGADLAGRIGPKRVTTEGWLPASQVQAAAAACFALALLPGAYLAAYGGWPIVAIGAASIAAGAAYTAGPRPIAYSGWGEVYVVVFFGLVAVGGMYYLHAGTAGLTPLVAGAAWFAFPALCEGPRGVADYIDLARAYHTILVSNVPQFTPLMEDAARRFIELVDELYDRGVNLVVSAAAPAIDLYDGERLRAEFARTESRLIEMQSEEYLAREHRA